MTPVILAPEPIDYTYHMESAGRITASYLDNLVGNVAAAICRAFAEPPEIKDRQFMLLPAITYKVKLCLARAQTQRRWSEDHFPEMAKDIRAAIVPLMWAFDFPTDLIYQLSPIVEKAALDTLVRVS